MSKVTMEEYILKKAKKIEEEKIENDKVTTYGTANLKPKIYEDDEIVLFSNMIADSIEFYEKKEDVFHNKYATLVGTLYKSRYDFVNENFFYTVGKLLFKILKEKENV